jgi:hypothetical protein
MELEVEDRRFELKRKADLHELEVEERRLKLPLAIQKQNLQNI